LTGVLAFVAVIFVFFNFLIGQISMFVQDFPSLKIKALANMEYLRLFVEENFGVDPDNQHLWMKERVQGLFESGSTLLSDTINATAGTIFQLLLIPVFMFYMLRFREQFRSFVVRVSPKKRKGETEKIMRDISIVIQRYISGVFTVVLILCVLNSLGLYIIGLKYAVIFGIISALFNLIPYFGTWIGAFFPIVFALLTGDSPGLAFSVFLFYLIIQFTENNILTPNITGSYVRLNPLITILSIIVGGMVWGVAGMLIVIPFMATIKILFEQVEELRPYAYLIGNERAKRYRIIFRRLRRQVGLNGFSKNS
jgi:predicted PurR-regulated permease PerM